jgi:hypothetical protein
MALKSDRVEAYTDISFFCNDSSAERGGIVVHATGVSGSGVAMDDSNAVVTYAASASGRLPAGLLLNDVVSLDLTRQHINWHRDEVQTGSKVTLLRQGQVTTNLIVSGVSPGPGSGAYVGANGYLTTVSTNSTKVGTFLSSKDADGYAKVDINLT